MNVLKSVDETRNAKYCTKHPVHLNLQELKHTYAASPL